MKIRIFLKKKAILFTGDIYKPPKQKYPLLRSGYDHHCCPFLSLQNEVDTPKNFNAVLFIQVLFLTSVSTDITEANVKAMSEKSTISGNRPLIRQSSSMVFSQAQDEVRY